MYTYELALGVKLNQMKSVILEKTPFVHPFTAAEAKCYCFWLNKNSTLSPPPNMIPKLIHSLTYIKRLHLSLLHKLTILKAYIRPKYLYIFTITPISTFIINMIHKLEN